MMNRKLKMMAIALMISAAGYAQDFKIGYTTLAGIVSAMPEMVVIKADLTVYQTQLSSKVNTAKTNYDNKVNEYQALIKLPTTTEQMVNAKVAEIQALQVELENMGRQADESLGARQNDLYAPVYEKVQLAIIEVRKKLGYSMILDQGSPGTLPIILAAEDADNITEAVFEHLGVPMPTQATAAADSTGNGN